MSNPILQRIQKQLDERKQASLFRKVSPLQGECTIDCATNSYLSLHNCEEVKNEAKGLTNNCYSGNLASRLVATYSPLYQVLEDEIADWKKTEASLVFNSGYAANVGIISALASRETEIFCDRLNHASIIDGIKLSGASLSRYAHCDMADLANRLRLSAKKEKIIITDSVFSMDGDVAPLVAICKLAKEFDCMVMVDEAHATGVFGNTLCGCVEEYGLQNEVHVVMGTLSKSIAGLGGFFAGSTMLRDYFVNMSRSLIYSTGLPQSVLAYDIAAIRYIRKNTQIGKTLLDKSNEFRKGVQSLGFNTQNSTTHIIPCIVGSDEQAVALARFLFSKGIKAPAIRPPTVQKGTSRIRFSVHLGMTNDDMITIVDALAEWKKLHE